MGKDAQTGLFRIVYGLEECELRSQMPLLFPLRVDDTTSCQREVGAGGAGRKVSKDILDLHSYS